MTSLLKETVLWLKLWVTIIILVNCHQFVQALSKNIKSMQGMRLQWAQDCHLESNILESLLSRMFKWTLLKLSHARATNIYWSSLYLIWVTGDIPHYD